MSITPRSIFITGAGGYLGTELVKHLAGAPNQYRVTAFDLREIPAADRLPGVEYRTGDIRDSTLTSLLREANARTVVHLASIVNPGGPERREFERSVDVGGTENVLASCVETGVEHLVITSSGAAYGYHADNPHLLRESDSLRGNPEFPYADHKRIIEERLAEFRITHPKLKQLVLRPGTILGARTDNQITRLFNGPCIVGIAGYETPFVFIWDEDVTNIILQGIDRQVEGIYNLAGDGAVTLREIAQMTRKPYLPVPAILFKFVLALLQKTGRSKNGPDQIIFLQYRPVLANDSLKQEFGYIPEMTSREAFAYYWEHRRRK